MASASRTYTLFGFCDELDRKTVQFVDAIPEHRICSACGLLPKVTVLLPCGHALCEACYTACVRDDPPSCPLNGEEFCADDVDWRDFPVENLSRRLVKCWNAENGCEVDIAASAISNHFRQECRFHSTRCPKCAATVLCQHVCAHLKSKCLEYRAPSKNSVLQTSEIADQERILTAFKDAFDARIVNVRDAFDRTLNDKLSEVSHSVNTLKEGLAQPSERDTCLKCAELERKGATALAEVNEHLASQSAVLSGISRAISTLSRKQDQCFQGTTKSDVEVLDHKINCISTSQSHMAQQLTAQSKAMKNVSHSINSFKQTIARELHEATKEVGENFATKVVDRIARFNDQGREVDALRKHHELLRLGSLAVTRYEFCVRGVSSLKATALSTGVAMFLSDRIYLSGYYLSPGVVFQKKDAPPSLCSLIQLHKGVFDELIEWPFSQEIVVTFIHMSASKKRQIVCGPVYNPKYFGRPDESSNEVGYFAATQIPLEELEREGYVSNDKIFLMWEFVSRSLKK